MAYPKLKKLARGFRDKSLVTSDFSTVISAVIETCSSKQICISHQKSFKIPKNCRSRILLYPRLLTICILYNCSVNAISFDYNYDLTECTKTFREICWVVTQYDNKISYMSGLVKHKTTSHTSMKKNVANMHFRLVTFAYRFRKKKKNERELLLSVTQNKKIQFGLTEMQFVLKSRSLFSCVSVFGVSDTKRIFGIFLTSHVTSFTLKGIFATLTE